MIRLLFTFVMALFCNELAGVPSATLFTLNEWSEIAPYLLPDTHPVKPALDRIFSGERAVRSQEALKNAGFHLIQGHWSDTVIATHKGAEGYFFKLFTEDQTHIDEVTRLLARIKGALYTQSIIDNHQWNKFFKVPRKWLYILPEDENPLLGIPSKRVVLIAEDMKLLAKKDNYYKWRRSDLNKKLFKAVFQLLTEAGLSDSCYAFNIPFAKDGKIALIDTDKYNERPIPFHKLFMYLHPSLKNYGKKLIEESPHLAF